MPRIDDLKRLKAEGKSARRVYGHRPEKYSLSEIREAGYTAAEAKTISGIRPSSLRHAGYTGTQMVEAGYGARDLRKAGFGPLTLLDAGLDAADLYRVGYSASSLRRAEVSATTLREAGAEAIALLRGGYDLAPMREAGYSAAELVRHRITTEELVDAGYGAADLEPYCDLDELWRYGFDARELREAGCSADELQHYFGLGELIDAGFPHVELEAVGFDAADFHSAGSKVPPLKGIFTIEEMRDGGFGSAELTVTGGWDSQTERAAVEEAYSAQNDIMRDAEAGQVDLDRIRRVKDEFLEKSSNLYRFTLEKRQFRDDLISTDLGSRLFRGFFTRRKTLANLRAEVQNIIKFDKKHFPASDVGMQRRIAHLEQMVVKIDEHVAEKARLREELSTVKERLDDLIKLRVATLDKQIKGTWRHDGLQKRIAPSLAELEGAYKKIDRTMREGNYDLAVAGFPLRPDVGDQQRKDLLDQRRQRMGTPLDLDSIKAISDPYLEQQIIDGDTLTDLSKLMHLDRKVELLTWSVKELKAEREGLKQLKDLKSKTASLWTFVNRIEKCFPSFKSLADSVTKVTRSSKLLLGKSGQKSKKHWTKQKRLTGSRDIALEVGLNFGPDLVGASITIGLSVVVTGTLTVEDDWRFRAAIDIQLVPNFKAKVGRGDANLAELSAKLGFTVKNAKYAFVDEKHFAYYMAFRIANIYILRKKLTAYGSRALNQHFGLYDDEVKDVLEKMYEGSEGRLSEMEDYLSNRPVVKAVVPKLNCPDIDFGFSSTVIPLEAGASANPYKRVVFRKSKLEIPKSNGAAAPAPAPARAVDVPELWEFEAAADGHCFFYSALFLLEWNNELWLDASYEKRGFRTLRTEAVTQWRTLFLHRDEAGYEAFKAHLDAEWEDEDVREAFLEGMEEGSTYAEASMIYALADLYDAKIKVYAETGEVYEYTGRYFNAESDPVLHFGHRFERGGHYWPLLPGNGATEAPDPTSEGLELLH